MKKHLLMMLCCLAALLGNAAEVTISMKDLAAQYTANENITEITPNDDITITLGKGANSNAPLLHKKDANLRFYVKNTITFKCTANFKITKIAFKCTTSANTFVSTASASNGSIEANGTAINVIWTGDTNDVTITNGTANSGHAKITSITVTYEAAGGTTDPEEVMPVFTVAENDWENEAKGIVYKGATVTISAPEGTPAGWIMGYKVNDGAEEITEEAVTLTINANTTITAYIDDEANAVTKTFTVAQIAPLTIDPAFGAVVEGTQVEITTATPGALLYGFVGDTTFDGTALPYTFTVNAATEVNVWAENPRYADSDVLEGEYTIMIPSAAPKWEAVTSVDQLKDGDIVTFTAKEYITKNVSIPAVIMNAYNSTSSYINSAAYDWINDEFSVTPYTFTINKTDDGKFTFKNADGKYMTHSGTSNTLNLSDNAAALSVEIGENSNAIVTADTQGTKTYKLQYYPQNSKGTFDYTTLRFSFYASPQQDVYMYRQLPMAPARPSIDGIEKDEDQLSLTVGSELTIRCEEGSTIAYKEESLSPAAIAPRAATDEWINTNENPFIYQVQELGKRLSFAAIKNGIYSEPTVITVSDSGVTTGVENVEAAAAESAAEYYNLQGVKVANPTSGLYIRHQGGKAEKVVIR